MDAAMESASMDRAQESHDFPWVIDVPIVEPVFLEGVNAVVVVDRVVWVTLVFIKQLKALNTIDLDRDKARFMHSNIPLPIAQLDEISSVIIKDKSRIGQYEIFDGCGV
jgi:hypothetical protein